MAAQHTQYRTTSAILECSTACKPCLVKTKSPSYELGGLPTHGWRMKGRLCSSDVGVSCKETSGRHVASQSMHWNVVVEVKLLQNLGAAELGTSKHAVVCQEGSTPPVLAPDSGRVQGRAAPKEGCEPRQHRFGEVHVAPGGGQCTAVCQQHLPECPVIGGMLLGESPQHMGRTCCDTALQQAGMPANGNGVRVSKAQVRPGGDNMKCWQAVLAAPPGACMLCHSTVPHSQPIPATEPMCTKASHARNITFLGQRSWRSKLTSDSSQSVFGN